SGGPEHRLWRSELLDQLNGFPGPKSGHHSQGEPVEFVVLSHSYVCALKGREISSTLRLYESCHLRRREFDPETIRYAPGREASRGAGVVFGELQIQKRRRFQPSVPAGKRDARVHAAGHDVLGHGRVVYQGGCAESRSVFRERMGVSIRVDAPPA